MSFKNTVTAYSTLAATAAWSFLANPLAVLAEDPKKPEIHEDCDLSNLKLGANGTITGCDTTGDMTTTGNNILGKGRTLVSLVTGVAAIVLLIIFIIKAVSLARSGDNPSERQRAIQGLIYLFIGIALLGSASLITGMFWNFLK